MWNWLIAPFKRNKNLMAIQPPNLPAVRECGDEECQPWWGTFEIEEEQSRFWKIAHHVICLDRYNHEWHIAHYIDNETDHGNQLVTENQFSKEKLKFKTFASYSMHKSIILKPSLPNRPLLCQLERSLYIPAGEEIVLYISIPAWITVKIGKHNIILDEIPSHQLSDTWHGKNTLEGELCYAIRNHCAPRLEDLPHGITQILTPITVINRSKSFLLLKEMRIPLPYLSVYSDQFNYLWTEQINLYFDGHEEPQSTLIKGPHKALKDLNLLTAPRLGTSNGFSFKKLLNPFTVFTRNT